MGQVTYSYRPEARLLAGQMLLTILSTQITVIALNSCFVFLRYMEVSIQVDATQLLYRLVRKLARKMHNVINVFVASVVVGLIMGSVNRRIESEELKRMNETSLAIARKVILCVGLLVSALLFLYPHWRMAVEMGDVIPAFNHDAGRAFILSPPMGGDQPVRIPLIGGMRPVFRINYARQFTEVGIAILFTFGLMRALRKPALGLSDSDKARLTERLSEKVNDE